MSEHSRVRAVYTDGVFKPLDAVSLPDNTQVELAVVNHAAFDAWWGEHAERMRLRSAGFSAGDVDVDVSAARAEARAKRGHGA